MARSDPEQLRKLGRVFAYGKRDLICVSEILFSGQ